jgi:hypothetical protein
MSATKKHSNAAKISKWDKKPIIEEAIKKRLDGVPYAKIKEYIIHHHGVSVRNAEYYIKDVVAIITETYNNAVTPEEIQLKIAETVAELEKLYESAEKVSDKLAIRKEIAELQGLKKGKGGSSHSDAPTMIPIQINILRDSVTTDAPTKMINVSRTKNESND